jgi:hypothetical protein
MTSLKKSLSITGRKRVSKPLEDDMQAVKLKTAFGKLEKEIVVRTTTGSLRVRFNSASMSDDLLSTIRQFPQYEHLNMTTIACAYVYTQDIAQDDDEHPKFVALMTAYKNIPLDFSKVIESSNVDYIRLKTDIIRYAMLF